MEADLIAASLRASTQPKCHDSDRGIAQQQYTISKTLQKVPCHRASGMRVVDVALLQFNCRSHQYLNNQSTHNAQTCINMHEVRHYIIATPFHSHAWTASSIKSQGVQFNHH